MLAAKVIPIRLVPGFAGGSVQGVDGNREVLVGLGVVAIDLDIHGFAWRLAQVRQGADDTELCFLMVGLGAEDQVHELWARRGKSMRHESEEVRR
ncbi:hypothetical protein D3C81_2114190 [compost metagenome]